MTKRFYVDTSIWRDYFENRNDGLKPLGEFAFLFLKQCAEKDFEILVSDAVMMELEIALSSEKISLLFAPFKKAIHWIDIRPEQISEAKEEWIELEKKLSFGDVLHAIVARDYNAILVTRDKHFFEFLDSIAEIRKPEEIIFG